MKWLLSGLVLAAVFCLSAGCHGKGAAVAAVGIAYPQGETQLLVQRSGDDYLFCGACPQHDKIRSGTFDIDDLLKELRPRLHEADAPLPEPDTVVGTVRLTFSDNTNETYLIFDQYAFTRVLFDKARRHIVGKQ